MNDYYNLELTILSCLLQRPELMKDLVDNIDNYFIKYKKLLIFMKAVYKKFGNFDLTLMTSITKNKYRIMEYIELLIDKEPAPSKFKQYQQQLIDLYNETKKERYIIDEVYRLANDLFAKNISVKDFDYNYKIILQKADMFFKEVKDE